MDPILLDSRARLEQTRKFADWLQNKQYGVKMSYWMFDTQYDRWTLFIVSEKYNKRVVLPLPQFIEVSEYIENNHFVFYTLDLRFVPDDEPIAKDLAAMLKHWPTKQPLNNTPIMELGPTVIGGRYVPKLYLTYVSQDLLQAQKVA